VSSRIPILPKQQPANVEFQLDSSANAGCRRGLLRRLGSPCIGLRGRALLSPYPDCSSGHARHRVFPSIATGNDPGAEWFIRWPRRELPHACALASTWIAGFRDINERSEWRRRWLPRLWAECPLRVPLCALHLGLSQLTCILLVGKLLVLWACHQSPAPLAPTAACPCRATWVPDSIALVVVIHDVPQCFHRSIVEVGPGHEDIP
jgi:hypothetical protein